jgi:hypothetical protein
MKKETVLKRYMNTIPYSDYRDVKWSIIEGCSITDAIWKNWLKGITPVPPLAREKIATIIGRNIFDAPEFETPATSGYSLSSPIDLTCQNCGGVNDGDGYFCSRCKRG